MRAARPGVLRERRVRGRELLHHERAEVGQRAAGEDEGQGHRLPAVVGEAQGLAVLVHEGDVRHRVARVRLVGARPRRRVRVGGALLHDHEVLEPVAGVGRHQGGGDLVAGAHALQEGRVLLEDDEGHGHRGHEPRDVLVGDRDLAVGRVDLDDFPLRAGSAARRRAEPRACTRAPPGPRGGSAEEGVRLVMGPTLGASPLRAQVGVSPDQLARHGGRGPGPGGPSRCIAGAGAWTVAGAVPRADALVAGPVARPVSALALARLLALPRPVLVQLSQMPSPFASTKLGPTVVGGLDAGGFVVWALAIPAITITAPRAPAKITSRFISVSFDPAASSRCPSRRQGAGQPDRRGPELTQLSCKSATCGPEGLAAVNR